MGKLCRDETPVIGYVRLRVPASGVGLVRFTLDPESDTGRGGAVWWTCFTALSVSGNSPTDVQQLVDAGLKVVRAQVPSVSQVQLETIVERSGLESWVVCEGPVWFLRSEWVAAKSAPELGEMLTPGQRDVVRVSGIPVLL